MSVSASLPIGVGNRGLVAVLVGMAVLAGFVLRVQTVLGLTALALFLLAGLSALVAQSRAPLAGVAALLVAGVLTPFEVVLGGSTINACLPIAAFVCATWVWTVVVSRRDVVLDGSRAVVAVLVFMAVALLSFVVGQFPWFETPGAPIRAQVGGLALFLLSGGLFLVAGHATRDLARLRFLTGLFVASGVLAVAVQILPHGSLRAGRIAVTSPDSVGSMFWTWIVAVTVSQWAFNRDLTPGKRWMLLAVGALALARGLGLAFSWVSGWLPPLVAVGVVALMKFPRVTIAAVVLGAAPALYLARPAFDTLMVGESYSYMTRGEALRVMWRVIEHNPLLGFGPANYYHYTVLFPILGWRVRFNSHNNYVDLLAQTGFVGLLAFLWFSVEMLVLAVRLYRRVPPGFPQAYTVGVLAGLAGSLVAGLLADWIVPFTYNIGLRGFRSSMLFWFFLGGLLALKRITTPHQAHPGFEYAPPWRFANGARAGHAVRL
jgi:hypothetical protein